MEDKIASLLRAVRDGNKSVDAAARELQAMQEQRISPVIAKLLRVRMYQAGNVKFNVALPPSLARMALSLIPKDALRGIDGSQIDAVIGAVNAGTTGIVFDYDDGEVRYEVVAET